MDQQHRADLIKLLQINKKQLDEIVLDFLPTNHSAREIANLYEMMRDYPSRGGKGLRGSTCLLWCELLGGMRQDALTTAAALELFQNWILIHDDIEDDSDLRRGKPTMHKKFGVPLAINTGDALHGKMWEMLLRNSKSMSVDTTVRILVEFSRMLNETTEGQQMELSWTAERDWKITEADYLLMVTKKSAWYTCISPCRLGVTAARESLSKTDFLQIEKVLENIISFGTDLGVSFQIIDDVLNLTADQGKYGKEILGDIFEGKRTLMLIHMLANCKKRERTEMIQLLSKERKDKTIEEAETIYQSMRDYGSIDYAKSVAEKYSINALKKFNSIIESHRLANTRVYQDCRNLIEYLTMRDY